MEYSGYRIIDQAYHTHTVSVPCLVLHLGIWKLYDQFAYNHSRKMDLNNGICDDQLDGNYNKAYLMLGPPLDLCQDVCYPPSKLDPVWVVASEEEPHGDGPHGHD